MSDMLSAHEEALAMQIGDWAGRIYIDTEHRAEHKARNAAETFADDVAAITMWPLPKRVFFRGIAGKVAVRYIRTFG